MKHAARTTIIRGRRNQRRNGQHRHLRPKQLRRSKLRPYKSRLQLNERRRHSKWVLRRCVVIIIMTLSGSSLKRRLWSREWLVIAHITAQHWPAIPVSDEPPKTNCRRH